jgi:hypothetical protein
MKFKVGDEVRVVRAWGPLKEWADNWIGRSGQVVEVRAGRYWCWPYRVQFSSPIHARRCFSARELELIPKAKRRPGKK